ncbi:MAG: hypothetical protein WC485_00200 [Opitutaceae bacterium]
MIYGIRRRHVGDVGCGCGDDPDKQIHSVVFRFIELTAMLILWKLFEFFLIGLLVLTFLKLPSVVLRCIIAGAVFCFVCHILFG